MKKATQTSLAKKKLSCLVGLLSHNNAICEPDCNSLDSFTPDVVYHVKPVTSVFGQPQLQHTHKSHTGTFTTVNPLIPSHFNGTHSYSIWHSYKPSKICCQKPLTGQFYITLYNLMN